MNWAVTVDWAAVLNKPRFMTVGSDIEACNTPVITSTI
jgi:hypothetical protein